AFTGYRGIGKDITARKRDEALLKLEHAVARQLAEADSAADGLKAVMRAICETEDWDSGRYFVWDEKAGVLRFQEYWSVPGERMAVFLGRRRALPSGPGVGRVGGCSRGDEPLWSPDTSTDTRVHQRGFGAAAGVHGAFFFPVSILGKPHGVVSFASREV